jgi:hypothetical protein
MTFNRACLFEVFPAFNQSSELEKCLAEYLEAEKNVGLPPVFSQESWKIFRASWQVKWFLEGQDWPEKTYYLPRLESDFQEWLLSREPLSLLLIENLRDKFYRWKIALILGKYLGEDFVKQRAQEFADLVALLNKK